LSRSLDWEGAKKRDALAKYPSAAKAEKGKKRAHRRQQAMQKFAAVRALACFVCGGSGPTVEWAKTGVSKRGPWALCADCARHKRQAARPASPTAEA
jgi:hypothetical protein